MDNHYSIRSDAWIANSHERAGEIIRVFNSGFDVRFGDDYVFFTLEEENLHPCSVLVSLDSTEGVYEGLKISFGQTLNFAQRKWVAGPFIASVEKPKSVSHSGVEKNIKSLENNLKLFGKKSVIHTFVSSDGSAKHDVFKQMMQDLNTRKLMLDNYIEIVGVGEGLTPSVDDFFSGMLLADRFSSNNYIYASNTFFSNASSKTTRQSVLQMRFSEQGLLSLNFERFLKQFVQTPIKSAEIVRLLNYGHTSGSDILSGILFYFKNAL